MNLFFASRSKARNCIAGKLSDQGASAPQGQRWARSVKVSATRKALTPVRIGGAMVTIKRSKLSA